MGQTWETFKVTGDDLVRRVKEILHEGNVRRIVIKQGARTVAVPVTVGVVGALPRWLPWAPWPRFSPSARSKWSGTSDPAPPTVRVSRKKKS